MSRAVTPARLRQLLGSSLDRSPAYLGLADGLRLLISDGRVPPGTRLPSERALTTSLGVSRTTVSRAYAVLKERGFLASRQGSGHVARVPEVGGNADPVLMPADRSGDTVDLTCAAAPAPPGVASAYEAAVQRLPAFLTGTGYFPSGIPALTELLADRYTARGLPTDPQQIVVTSGALAGTSVVARTLTRTGDRVLVESPSYPNAIASLRRSGARVLGAAVDPDGWDLPSVVDTVRQVRPRAAYLIPDFQNPTGHLMAEEQRAQLARALQRNGTVAVVDETLVDMVLDPGPEPFPRPMAAFAPDTVTVGGASKAFWGGLRIGWVRAPHRRMGELVSERLGLDLGAPVLEQLVLVELLSHPDDVLEHHRARLRESRAALAGAVRERLPDWRFVLPRGGLALWCELPAARSTALAAAAERHGLVLPAGPSFAAEGGLERFVRLPFTQTPEVLTEAVARLVPAWEEATSRAEGARRRRRSGRRSPLVA